jgi:hypothetical protein
MTETIILQLVISGFPQSLLGHNEESTESMKFYAVRQSDNNASNWCEAFQFWHKTTTFRHRFSDTCLLQCVYANFQLLINVDSKQIMYLNPLLLT